MNSDLFQSARVLLSAVGSTRFNRLPRTGLDVELVGSSRGHEFGTLIRRGLLRVSFGLMLTLTAGCGGAEGPVRHPVSGRVTLDGTPLSFGVIRLVPKDTESPGAFTQILDGEFRFTEEEGPVRATYRVEIEATEHQGFEIDDEAAFAAAMQKTGKSPMAGNPVPAIYNQASTLTAEVTGNNNQVLQFDLISKQR